MRPRTHERIAALGFSEADTATLTSHFLDAESRGKLGHGLSRIDWLETLPDLQPDANPRRLHVEEGYERWDGNGYPDGLRGETIPIGARIVGLVDAYDAIIHDRPYRPARSVEAALEELHAQAGAQFDPELVRMFVPLIEQEVVGLGTPSIRVLEALRTAV